MNYKLLLEIFAVRRKSFLLIIGLLLLNICAYVYLASSQRAQLAALQNEWFVKRQAVASGAIVGVSDIYTLGTRDLSVLRSKILPKKDFAKFLGELFETAANNNLVLKGVTYKPVPLKDEKLLAYILTFNLSGKYAAIKSFISDMVRSHEILTIDTIGLSNKSVIEESIDLKIQITTYLRMEGT